jgi:hypothetical protein
MCVGYFGTNKVFPYFLEPQFIFPNFWNPFRGSLYYGLHLENDLRG